MDNIASILQEDKKTLIKRIRKGARHKGRDCWLWTPENTVNKICLVAHIDTVWDNGKVPVKRILHDKEQGLIWSPDGLGADDRAGVYAAIAIFKSVPEPYKPCILFTDYEEVGGLGAEEAANRFYKELSPCAYFIELDRRGSDDAVFYNGEPDDFIEYIEEFGFKQAKGSFSDISIICPAVNRCGVNLSIGYYGEHTAGEYLNTKQMRMTMKRVNNMLISHGKNPRDWFLPEGTDKWDNYYQMIECPKCGAIQDLYEVEYNDSCCIECGKFLKERDKDRFLTFAE